MSHTNEGRTAAVIGAFDSIAPSFEKSFENTTTQSLRRKLYSVINNLVRPGSSVLDINCGIGIDAVSLALQGYRVVGVDIAPKMIEQAEARAKKFNAANVRFQIASFEDLSAFQGQRFDLILSNFGGMNCVPSLSPVAEQLANLIEPGGHVVAVVMPSICVWEILAGIVRFRMDISFRRMKESVYATGFGENTFPVHYYSPRLFARVFRPWFEASHLSGLNVFSPPPGATQFRHAHPHLSGILDVFDDVVAQLPVVRSIGDHFMITLRRTSNGRE